MAQNFSVLRVMRAARRVVWVLLALMLTACGGGEATPDAPAVAVKALVTVEIPPTLNAQERMATRMAAPTTPTDPPPTATYTPTPYIGVFIGAADVDTGGAPMMPQNPDAAPTEIGLCTVATDAAFGELWRRDASLVRRLGCAIQERFGFDGAVQVFERGVMYRRSSTNEVWAISPGRVTGGRYWYTNQVPIGGAITGITPPQQGQRIPVDTFGAVWSSNPPVQEALGYGITPEQTADLNIQRFEGGTLFLDVTVGQVFVLLVNGDAYGPFSLD